MDTTKIKNIIIEVKKDLIGKNAKYIFQVFSRKEINQWLQENNEKIIDQEYYEIFTGNLWGFGERICPPRKVNREDRHHLTCICIQKI